MIQKEDILNFLRNNSEYLHRNFQVTEIGLFGSFARNEQNEDSDIDLIVEFESGVNDLFGIKQKLKDFLKQNLGKDVEICREKYLKPYAKPQIQKEVIYVT